MNLDELKRILEIVREHELIEFELEQEGVKLRLKKQGLAVSGAVPASQAATPNGSAGQVSHLAPPPGPVVVPLANPAASDEAEVEFAVVKSPIVGTFYRAPEPGAPPFAEVGAVVKKGQVLCIIEAMKMMNNIDSEYSGTVVKVYAENGQPVQFGERLFAIRAK
jgi:acetyl-CoA carboxylase biotin carboxyl carrier protein